MYVAITEALETLYEIVVPQAARNEKGLNVSLRFGDPNVPELEFIFWDHPATGTRALFREMMFPIGDAEAPFKEETVAHVRGALKQYVQKRTEEHVKKYNVLSREVGISKVFPAMISPSQFRPVYTPGRNYRWDIEKFLFVDTH